MLRVVRDLRAARAVGRRDFRGAIAVLEQDIERHGEDEFGLRMLAQCHEWVEDYGRALDYAQRALASDPADPALARTVSRCYCQLGDFDLAYVYLEAALSRCPEPRAPRRTAGWLRRLRRVPLLGRLARAALEREEEAREREREWRRWAARWKKWYESRNRGSPRRVLH